MNIRIVIYDIPQVYIGTNFK